MRYIILIVFVLGSQSLLAQSKTTEELHKKYSDALSFFFYNNTLRMLNQDEDKEFDELIKDIDKMKLLMIKRDATHASDAEIKKLSTSYKAEAFEEMMTARHEGKNFDIYLKENGKGKAEGMIILVNDSTTLYVMDVVGSIQLNKVTNFFNSLDRNSELGKKIKAFSDKAID